MVEHGHRRIAVAGYLNAVDQLERYETYRRTLRAHGIAPDPAGDNQEVEGGPRDAPGRAAVHRRRGGSAEPRR